MIPCYHTRGCSLQLPFSSLAASGSAFIHSANTWALSMRQLVLSTWNSLVNKNTKSLTSRNSIKTKWKKEKKPHTPKENERFLKHGYSEVEILPGRHCKKSLGLDMQKQVQFLMIIFAFPISWCRRIYTVVLVTNLYWGKIGHLSVTFILHHWPLILCNIIQQRVWGNWRLYTWLRKCPLNKQVYVFITL